MRAIGLRVQLLAFALLTSKANQVILLYVFESLCLVLSCAVLGSIIGFAIRCVQLNLSGITVAIVLTLQFNLFTQLPFKFNVLCCSIIFQVCVPVHAVFHSLWDVYSCSYLWIIHSSYSNPNQEDRRCIERQMRFCIFFQLYKKKTFVY